MSGPRRSRLARVLAHMTADRVELYAAVIAGTALALYLAWAVPQLLALIGG